MKWYPDYSYILGSGSPRRQQLLHELGLPFTIRVSDTSEDFPEGLEMTEIPVYLAERKAGALALNIASSEMLITADTIVWLKGEVLGKPENIDQAKEILQKLSGQTHQVVTGVCLMTHFKKNVFSSVTEVEFKKLTDKEIDYYVSRCMPLDKAGAYGIQEWIGLAGVSAIRGSYYNVVGLPVMQLYEAIRNFNNS